MKLRNIFLMTIFLGAASMGRAEYYAHCTLSMGAERALLKAPESFYLVDGRDLTLKEVFDNNEARNFAVRAATLKDLSVGDKIRVKSLYKKGGLTESHTYTFNLSDCDNRDVVKAIFTWRIEEMDAVQNNGNAFYNCKCAQD